MRMLLRLAILLGIGGVGIVVLGYIAGARDAHPRLPSTDYFAPTSQPDSPPVAWMREFDSGLGGDLITDRKGGVFLWYETDSHVLKYDRRGKLVWDKRFAPRGQNAWCNVVSNPNGELFISRQMGEERLLSRLMSDGTLGHEIHLSREMGLVSGLYAVDVNAGWVVIEFRGPSETYQLGAKEYLSKYSPQGKREWSVFLQDTGMNLDNAHASYPSVPLDITVDAQGNSYVLLGDSGSLTGESPGGHPNGELRKFRSNNALAWSTRLSSDHDTVLAMRLGPRGNTYFTGQRDGLGYYVGRVDQSGKQVWRRTPGNETGDVAERMAVDDFGSTYVAGSNRKDGRIGTAVTFVAKHDGSGSLLWRKELPKIKMTTGLAVDRDGVYVSGAVQGGGARMYLIKLGR